MEFILLWGFIWLEFNMGCSYTCYHVFSRNNHPRKVDLQRFFYIEFLKIIKIRKFIRKVWGNQNSSKSEIGLAPTAQNKPPLMLD